MRVKLILFYLQRTIRSFKLRKLITDIVAFKIGKSKFESNDFFKFTYTPALLNDLNNNGYVELPIKLSDDDVDQIKKQASDFDLIDPHNSSLGKFKLDKTPSETHVANYLRSDLSTLPIIEKLINDSAILALVQDFLGATPTISNINMWWSLIGRNKAKDAQLFHRDVDDLKFCKLFIYLTDVGENDGPHTYVKHSAKIDTFTKIRRYSDDEIYNAFGQENVVNFVRPKGSVFIVDTYGFHKGTLPIDNNRLILQIQYSLLPIYIEKYKPHKDITTKYNKYVNRLLYSA